MWPLLPFFHACRERVPPVFQSVRGVHWEWTACFRPLWCWTLCPGWWSQWDILHDGQLTLWNYLGLGFYAESIHNTLTRAECSHSSDYCNQWLCWCSAQCNLSCFRCIAKLSGWRYVTWPHSQAPFPVFQCYTWGVWGWSQCDSWHWLPYTWMIRPASTFYTTELALTGSASVLEYQEVSHGILSIPQFTHLFICSLENTQFRCCAMSPLPSTQTSQI